MFKYLNKFLVALTLIACILNSFVFLIEPLITEKIFDLTSLNNSKNIWDFLLYGLSLYLILYTVMFIANLLMNQIMTIGCGKIRLRLYKSLMFTYQYIENDKKISLLTQDVEYYLWNYISPSILLIAQLSNFFLLSIYLLSKNILIGLMFIVCALIYLLVQQVISKIAEGKGSKQTEERQTLLALVSDLVTGSSTLKQNQSLSSTLKSVQNQSEHYEESRQSFEITRSFFAFLANLMLFVSQLLPIFFGMVLITVGTDLRTTDLIAMFVAATRLEQPLLTIVDAIFSLKGAKLIAERFDQILSQSSTNEGIQSFSVDEFKALECVQLTKAFAGRTLFSDLSYRFEKGKKYLIKGPSGSGKSTFFKLILQEFDPDEGSVEMVLDNGQVTTAYHQRIGLISQSPYLFNDSIRYNLTLGGEFSDGILLEKLEQVGLTAEFDNILDYQIINNGENISGGQRARIEIARSLIRQKDVLLADEVTAPLDTKNAKKIRNLLFNLPVTVIEIAHHIDDEFVYDGEIDLSYYT